MPTAVVLFTRDLRVHDKPGARRARLITAAFLTKHLGLDWRHGVRWFFRWLLDGDVPNNSGNWQWVAGTGHDTRYPGPLESHRDVAVWLRP